MYREMVWTISCCATMEVMTANHLGQPHRDSPTHDHGDHHGDHHGDAHVSLHHEPPETAVQSAVQALRAHGERVTDARRAVLDVLARTHEHVSADHVVALLEHGHPHVHRATVYRTLDVLSEYGIVSSLRSPGGATTYHFATPSPGHEHLHAHCRICGDVVVIEADCLDEVTRKVAQASGLTIEPQQSTLVGVCARCAADARAAGGAVTPVERISSK